MLMKVLHFHFAHIRSGFAGLYSSSFTKVLQRMLHDLQKFLRVVLGPSLNECTYYVWYFHANRSGILCKSHANMRSVLSLLAMLAGLLGQVFFHF